MMKVKFLQLDELDCGNYSLFPISHTSQNRFHSIILLMDSSMWVLRVVYIFFLGPRALTQKFNACMHS